MHHTILATGAPTIAPRQQTVSAWGANRIRTVSISERNAFIDKPVHIGRLEFRFRIERAHVPVTLIIRVDEMILGLTVASAKTWAQRNRYVVGVVGSAFTA